MIPKIIHFCWFGRGDFSPAIRMCIDSWRKFCPDFEIKCWNEDNSPMNATWVRDAYKHRKYAFVADYVRFYALYNEGGIYMDTDMLLTKSIDDFLQEKAFIGREDQYNTSMGIIGCVQGHSFCEMCLDYYNQTKFDMVHPPIITRFITPLLFEYGLSEVDETQRLTNGLTIYKSDFFYPIHYSQDFDLSEVYSYVKPSTYGIHLWNKSWVDEFKILEAGQYKMGFAEVWRRVRRTPFLPFGYWKKVIKYFGRYIGLWKR